MLESSGWAGTVLVAPFAHGGLKPGEWECTGLEVCTLNSRGAAQEAAPVVALR